MFSFFNTLIEQGLAIVYIDDIIRLSNSKEHIFHPVDQFHVICTKHILKSAPENIILAG